MLASLGHAKAIRRLNALHRTITGPTYRARDPELSLWVHATLVDSTIVVADQWLEPLSRDRRAAHVVAVPGCYQIYLRVVEK